MDKVTQSSKNITPYGGLNFIYNAIHRAGIDKFLDNQIGSRSVLARYSYSDVVLSLLGNSLCQGDYISDLEHLKKKFHKQFFNKIPSPDTVEYVCQELKTVTTTHVTDSGIKHEINFNNALNSSLVALCVKTEQLQKEVENYILDFDNVVIPTEKQDARMSYKKIKGYHPNIAFIGRLPVHIENHNGNTPARYQQMETLQRCFNNLDSHEIKIKHFRADSASYQKNVVELLTEKVGDFYIRIADFEDLRMHCSQIKTWEKVEINYEIKEVASTLYCPFGEDKEYRIVVTRTLKKDMQIDFLSGSAYNYYGIMTRNKTFTNKEVIEFYNARGDAENSNRYLLEDFNLHHLPFPDMYTNTAYMYLMAMSSIIFDWIKIILIKNKTQNITAIMRVKAVCFHYITVATIFINHARQKILQVFSSLDYQILKI